MDLMIRFAGHASGMNREEGFDRYQYVRHCGRYKALLRLSQQHRQLKRIGSQDLGTICRRIWSGYPSYDQISWNGRMRISQAGVFQLRLFSHAPGKIWSAPLVVGSNCGAAASDFGKMIDHLIEIASRLCKAPWFVVSSVSTSRETCSSSNASKINMRPPVSPFRSFTFPLPSMSDSREKTRRTREDY